MIHSIDIRNFRCFERLEIGNCRRINLLVGDNGSGKTALLEAIFLALSKRLPGRSPAHEIRSPAPLPGSRHPPSL
jgi:AAA15 family ATPase/GTPase